MKADKQKLFPYPLMVLIFLSAGIIVYIFIYKNRARLFMLMIVDYFFVLLNQYYEPHFLLIELLWIPCILTVVILILPSPWNIPLGLIMGIPGAIFFSYGYFAGTIFIFGKHQYPYFSVALFYYLPVTILCIATGQIGQHIIKLHKHMDRLRTFNLQLNKINRDITDRMFNLQYDSTLEERKRISKGIHDTAGYVFINLIMMLQAALALMNKDVKKAENIIRDARDYAERGINEIRHILQDIRDYSPTPLSIQNMISDMGRFYAKTTSVEVIIDYGNWPKTFSKSMDSFFISFMQEALTNALKHGHATSVSILCWASPTHVTMRIRDNGNGTVLPIVKGIGISAMEDFIRNRGGFINIQSNDGGFQISVSILRKEIR
jgi:signal transduction histidine kinase